MECGVLPLDKLMQRRLEDMKIQYEEFEKLFDYIRPLIQSNKEMVEIARKLRKEFAIGWPMSDLTLYAALQGERMIFNQLPTFCHACGQEIKDELEKTSSVR